MSGGYIKASLSQTLILSAISSNHTTKKEKKERSKERERERHGFAQAPEEARLERPQVWPWQGLARPK